MATIEASYPLQRDWTWMLARGLLAVALGLFGFAAPGVTIAALTGAWGVYTLVDGLVALTFARKATTLALPGWPVVLIGMLGIGAAILTFIAPFASTRALALIFGGWATAVGASEVVTALRLRRQIAHEVYLGLAGVVTLAFGIFLLARPLAGTVMLAGATAWFASAIGILLVMFALRLRSFETFDAPHAR